MYCYAAPKRPKKMQVFNSYFLFPALQLTQNKISEDKTTCLIAGGLLKSNHPFEECRNTGFKVFLSFSI